MTYRFFHRCSHQGGGEVCTTREVASESRAFLRLSCLLAVAILLLAADLHAQTSTVIGTITYSNGTPAVNVFVSIAGLYHYTDVGGRYKIEGVPQGSQPMTIKSGQRILWQGAVNISGTTAVVDQVLP
jgi:hypothetical protein